MGVSGEVQQRVFSYDSTDEDSFVEPSLRPRQFDEYIGQENVKQNMQIFIKAALERREPLDHVLLYGPPGLGKTTLAGIIAAEMGVNIKTTSGPAIERAGDLAAILTNLSVHDILFIDEIHRLSRCVEEVLYPAMEDYSLDIIIGKGPAARSVRIDLPKFTLVGATTRAGLLSNPLRDRFGVVCKLEMYKDEELCCIIKRTGHLLGVKFSDEAALALAQRSRGTPRIANRLARRVRDFAQINEEESVSLDRTLFALEKLGIDSLGLDSIDKKMLMSIINAFGGGPVGLDTLAAMIGEDAGTVEDVYEPFLLQKGFINRTLRGRVATKLAYDYLNIPYQI